MAKEAGPRKTDRPTAFYASLVDRLRQMTPEEFRRSLLRSGIITGAGQLTDKYKR